MVNKNKILRYIACFKRNKSIKVKENVNLKYDNIFNGDTINVTNNTTLEVNGATIENGNIILTDAKLKFLNGAKIKNCKITATNSTVEITGDDPVFEKCTFSNGENVNEDIGTYRFVNSSIKATHFGAVPDMNDTAIKDEKTGAYIYSGTDNFSYIGYMFDFCTYSNNLDVELNGSFFSDFIDYGGGTQMSDASRRFTCDKLRHTKNMKLHGPSNNNRAKLSVGLTARYNSNLEISYIEWVGYHTPHEWPPIVNDWNIYNTYKDYYPYKQIWDLYGEPWTMAKYHLKGLGLNEAALTIAAYNNNVTIHNCSAYMRTSGIFVGGKKENFGNESRSYEYNVEHAKYANSAKNIVIHDCDFSHMLYQPLGFHGSYITAYNVKSHYVMQGIDISTCANNTYIYNSEFHQCHTGFKQESAKPEHFAQFSYNNHIDNIYYEIANKEYYDIVHANDDSVDHSWTGLKFTNVDTFIFYSQCSRNNDTFKITNSTIDLNVAYCNTSSLVGIRSAAYNMLIDNSTINLNWKWPAKNDDNIEYITNTKIRTNGVSHNDAKLLAFKPITYNGKETQLLYNINLSKAKKYDKDGESYTYFDYYNYDILNLFRVGQSTNGFKGIGYESNYDIPSIIINNTYINIGKNVYYAVGPQGNGGKIYIKLNNSYMLNSDDITAPAIASSFVMDLNVETAYSYWTSYWKSQNVSETVPNSYKYCIINDPYVTMHDFTTSAKGIYRNYSQAGRDFAIKSYYYGDKYCNQRGGKNNDGHITSWTVNDNGTSTYVVSL